MKALTRWKSIGSRPTWDALCHERPGAPGFLQSRSRVKQLRFTTVSSGSIVRLHGRKTQRGLHNPATFPKLHASVWSTCSAVVEGRRNRTDNAYERSRAKVTWRPPAVRSLLRRRRRRRRRQHMSASFSRHRAAVNGDTVTQRVGEVHWGQACQRHAEHTSRWCGPTLPSCKHTC